MRQNLKLTITSLFMLALFTLHLADDTIHDKNGMDATGTTIVLTIMIVFLYGIVELAGRRSGYVITLLSGLASLYMPYLHTMGPRATRWGFEFIWTMLMMGLTGAFCVILSAKALWRSSRPFPLMNKSQ